MNIITPEQATAIARARVALHEIELEVRLAAANPKHVGYDQYSLGRFAEAVDSAEDKLFDMLNVASAHLGDEIAEDTVLFEDTKRFLAEVAYPSVL